MAVSNTGFTNYHTHCLHCDGAGVPEAYVQEAVNQGFDALGFSSHAPLPLENEWTIKPGQLGDYLADIRKLKTLFNDRLRIWLALEADYVPGMTEDFSLLKSTNGLDYIIGAVHLVKKAGQDQFWFIDGPVKNYDKGLKEIYDMDIRCAVEDYFRQIWEMIAAGGFDLIAHADKVKMNNRGRYFSTEESWYGDLIAETVSRLSAASAIVEVNTRGIYKQRYPETYPSPDMLKALLNAGVRVTISTDAHHPSEISSGIPDARRLLVHLGYKETMVLGADGWEPRPLSL